MRWSVTALWLGISDCKSQNETMRFYVILLDTRAKQLGTVGSQITILSWYPVSQRWFRTTLKHETVNFASKDRSNHHIINARR